MGKKKLNEWVEYEKLKNAKNDGREEGFEDGLEEGFENCLEAGTVETINEHVKNMFKENLDIGMISRITKLTEEEIIKIRNNLDNNIE